MTEASTLQASFDRNRYQYHMPKFVSVKVKDSTDHFNVAYDQAIANRLPGRIQLIPFAIRLMLAAMHDLNLYLAIAHELAPAMEMIGWLRYRVWAFC